MRIELIVATDLNGLIGINNALPWHEPNDLARFVAITKGCPVMMGRSTWESLPRKPLTGRMNIVVTTQQWYKAQKATVVRSPLDGIELAELHGYSKLFIIGGAQLYEWALDAGIVAEVHLTQFQRVELIGEKDTATYFPMHKITGFAPVEHYYRLQKTKTSV
jgi:dihydrofolate reductase